MTAAAVQRPLWHVLVGFECTTVSFLVRACDPFEASAAAVRECVTEGLNPAAARDLEVSPWPGL